jgi:hypothetical protein
MDKAADAHSSNMAHRLRCILVTLGIAGCAAETTSLGGPRGHQTSASTDSPPNPTPAFEDPNEPTSTSTAQCLWFAWDAVSSGNACEYLVPTTVPDHHRGTDLDPASWDPRNVRFDFGNAIDGSKHVSHYVMTREGCAGGDGWYYTEPPPPELRGEALPFGPIRPSRYMVCPKTCASVEGVEGAIKELAASSNCGAI